MSSSPSHAFQGTFSLPRELLCQVDEVAREERRSRSSAIRILVEDGLASRGKKDRRQSPQLLSDAGEDRNAP
jgi:metal-responsive CopG/Arc/MetJ family transcriptional regulator